MTHFLTAEDVLNEIEFELAQGAISKDDLGQAIQEVKKYQNKLRSEVFQPKEEMPPLRELVGRQFQLNDMLITMLQEMAATMQEMQLKSKRLAHWQSSHSPPARPSTTAVPPLDNSIWRDEQEIHEAMAEALEVDMEIRPTNVPVVGSWLQRFKHEMHALVVFYLRKLADRQTAVNRTYGNWALYFDTLHHYHQKEIHQLKRDIAALQEQLDARDTSNDGVE